MGGNREGENEKGAPQARPQRKNEENARRRRAKMGKWRAPKARGAFFRGIPLYFLVKKPLHFVLFLKISGIFLQKNIRDTCDTSVTEIAVFLGGKYGGGGLWRGRVRPQNPEESRLIRINPEESGLIRINPDYCAHY